MNILFYLHGECCPEVGGIERVTDVLSSYFRNNGHKCFLIYQEKADDGLRRTKFESSYYLPSNTISAISEIISKNEIDILINQEEHYVTSQIYDAVKLSKRDCKIIFTYHNPPLEGAKAAVSFKRIFKLHRIHDVIKLFCYPIYRFWNINCVRKQYRETLQKSDVNVMLSDCYIEPWYRAAKVKTNLRNKYAPVIAINNPTSFDRCSKNDDVIKEKRILICCRLYEPQKRVLKALKIWEELEDDSRFDDWSLDIVGDGPDRKMYEEYASKHLKRVTFYGRQKPEPFYKRASIYLMTSDYEGWPLTLIEAMQFGCVPVVFYTYESLSDIMLPQLSECIVKEGDISAFLNKLKRFIKDDSHRLELSLRCIEQTERFSVEKIGRQWIELFNRL